MAELNAKSSRGTFLPQAPYKFGIAPKVSFARWAIALLIAIVSDAASFVTNFNPLLQFGVDIATALLIWATLGWRWMFLVALIPEALPVVSVFPTWTLVILALKGAGMLGKKAEGVVQKETRSL